VIVPSANLAAVIELSAISSLGIFVFAILSF
jgi:hypothetical protein